MYKIWIGTSYVGRGILRGTNGNSYEDFSKWRGVRWNWNVYFR